jgi:hypothetical protein
LNGIVINPVLQELHHQQPPFGLVAQIHPFAETAAMIEIARCARTTGEMQRIPAPKLETRSAICGMLGLGKQLDLGHRGGSAVRDLLRRR